VAAKFYAYLAVAQVDFASLSQRISGSYKGNLSVISKKVFCEFYPTDCALIFVTGDEDEYSITLAEVVMKKIRDRIAEDERGVKDYPLKTSQESWAGAQPYFGLNVGSWKPWVMTSSDQFRVPPGPAFGSDELKEQLVQVNQALENITNDQKKAVVFWAGGPGTKTPPGIWLSITDQHLQSIQAPLNLSLKTRRTLTVAMMDASIGCFDSKYTYWSKRPFMLDKEVQTIMPTPNHPSYPAGHACVSGAAESVLSYFFPQNDSEWKSKAEEATSSRTWGGIHFPIDNQVGRELGQQVGKLVIEKLP
jgi:hypothetical protein